MSHMKFFQQLLDISKKEKGSPSERVRGELASTIMCHGSEFMIKVKCDNSEEFIRKAGEEVEALGGTWELKVKTQYVYLYEDRNQIHFTSEEDRGEIAGRIRSVWNEEEFHAHFAWLEGVFQN